MANSYLRLIEFNIPAGSGQQFGAPGSLVVIKDASAPFDLEFDDDGRSTFEGGFNIDTGADRFKKLHLYNRSATDALTGALYVGKGSGKAGVSYSYERIRPSVTQPSYGTAQAVGNLDSYVGVRSGLRRAHISIFNHSTTATDILWIRAPIFGTTAFFLCAEVRPGIPIKLETDATLQIFSSTGSAFQYSTLEVFTR